MYNVVCQKKPGNSPFGTFDGFHISAYSSLVALVVRWLVLPLMTCKYLHVVWKITHATVIVYRLNHIDTAAYLRY